MQKNDPLSVDENVEIKGQKIISNSSLTIANYVLHLYLGLKWSAVHFSSHIGGWSDLGLLVFAGKVPRGFSVTFRHALLWLCNS